MNRTRSSVAPEDRRGGSRREAHKASTNRVLLDAAYSLFEGRGYEATTMRAVAERAGVALGTIFVHFRDKRALLLAAFETDVASVIDEAFATVGDGKVRERLLHVAGRLYAFYARRPQLARVLVAQALFADGDAGARLDAQVSGFLRRVEALFLDAIGRGELRADVDATDAALGFWSDYFTALVAGLKAPELGPGGPLAVLARLLELRFAGIAPVAGARPRRRT